jgi:hypothetical protein
MYSWFEIIWEKVAVDGEMKITAGKVSRERLP